MLHCADLQHQISTTMQRYAEEFDAALKKLADKHGAFTNISLKIFRDISYQYSKALATDLNIAVQVDFEINANVFGAPAIQEFEESLLCSVWVETALPDMSELYYCSKESVSFGLCDVGLCGECRAGWNRSAKKVVDAIESALEETYESVDPATAFLSTLTQYSQKFGLRAAPMIKGMNYESVKVEIGPTYLEFTRTRPDTVYADYFVAYVPKGGWGSRIIGLVAKLADQFCVKIEGFANPMAEFEAIPEFQSRPYGKRMKPDELVAFYRRFGFEPQPSPRSTQGQGQVVVREPNCTVQ